MSIKPVTLVGHFAKDIVTESSHIGYAPGGGVYYGGLALCNLGSKVRVVSKAAPTDLSLFRRLTERSECECVISPSSTSTTFENVYPENKTDNRVSYVRSKASTFMEDEVPVASEGSAVIVTPLCGEFPAALLPRLRTNGFQFVAVDVQGYTRNVGTNGEVSQGDWVGRSEWLPFVDVLKIDNKGTYDLRAACDILLHEGVKFVQVRMECFLEWLVNAQKVQSSNGENGPLHELQNAGQEEFSFAQAASAVAIVVEEKMKEVGALSAAAAELAFRRINVLKEVTN